MPDSDDDLFGSEDEEELQQPQVQARSEAASAHQTEPAALADDDLFGSDDEQDVHTTSRKRQRRTRPAERRSTYLLDLPEPGTFKAVKLSSMLNIESKPFDPHAYEVGPDMFTDRDGTKRFNLRHLNTVRWRWTTDREGNRVPQSNARFVRWEDGSMTLMIGDESLSVAEVQEHGSKRYLYVRVDGLMQPLAPLSSRLQMHPTSLSSKLHTTLQILTSKNFVRDTRKVQATAATVDVRKAAEEAALVQTQMKEARAQLRAKKARQRKRYARNTGPIARAAAPMPRFNEGFLEEDDEGDAGYAYEDFDTGRARADLQRSRRPYDPDAEEAAERRLRAAQGRGGTPAKRSRIDDDDDEELSDFIASSGEEDGAAQKPPPSAPPKQPVRRGAAILDSDDDD